MPKLFQKGYDSRRNTTPPPNPNPPKEQTYPVCQEKLRHYIKTDSLSARQLSIQYCRHRDVLGHALRGTGRLTLSEADDLSLRWACDLEDLIELED